MFCFYLSDIPHGGRSTTNDICAVHITGYFGIVHGLFTTRLRETTQRDAEFSGKRKDGIKRSDSHCNSSFSGRVLCCDQSAEPDLFDMVLENFGQRRQMHDLQTG